jgi:RNA polymerase sigma-70 factor (ECF subfamily)
MSKDHFSSADSFDDSPEVDYESISILIPKSRDGDSAAQSQLFQQIQDYLELMAAKYMDKSLQQKLGPSDIVQQTMTQVIENFDKFRGGTAAEFRGWLKTIVINEMGKLRRNFRTDKRDVGREKRLDAAVASSGEGFAPTDMNRTPSSEAIAAEQIESFYHVLDQLPEDYAQIIRLRSIEQMPFREIAVAMNRSQDSVTKLWYRAVLKFEEKLRESGDFDLDAGGAGG